MPSDNPKLCECGCGQPAPIATRTDQKRGYKKGEPRRFISGHNRQAPVEIRFWSKVAVSGADECWEWQGYRNRRGYGSFSFAGHREAHRVSYLLANGPFPRERFVLHTCDNPPCVNPRHLVLGDAKENARQCVERKRSCVGERHGSARLTEEQVLEARAGVRAGASIVSFARRFGVHKGTMREAVVGKTWGHLPGTWPQ